MSDSQVLDLLIVGGGVNGCGIARDAVGRGLSVLLVEEADLAGATSSKSTKLIHGGLRYLEQYEFRLVHEALLERERLQALAPHIIGPVRFVLPHIPGIRVQPGLSAWVCSCTPTTWRLARSCPAARRSILIGIPSARRSRAITRQALPIPIAGSRTAAWSCSTPLTQANAARTIAVLHLPCSSAQRGLPRLGRR